MRFAFAVCLGLTLISWAAIKAEESPGPPGPWQSPPKLGKPAGTVVRVRTEPELQRAVRALRSGTTILIEPGTYRLTNTVHITGGVKDVAIRGVKDDRSSVVLKGPGMSVKDFGNVPHGIMVSDASSVLIANLTVGDVWFHPITLQGPAGCKNVRICNVRLFNAGEQFLKVNAGKSRAGVDNCTVEYCVFEYTRTARHNYTQGMSVHSVADWTVRNNLFRNIRGPENDPKVGGCIDFWHGSKNALVEDNVIVNCRMGIRFGIVNRQKEEGYHDQEGGIIRNNLIWRSPGAVESPDGGIMIWDSPNTKVLNNTVILNGTYPPGAIEYRWCKGLVLANNLTDAKIWRREGGEGKEENNVTVSDYALFKNAAGADLRPAAKAATVLPTIKQRDDCPLDADGTKRKAMTAPGAYEISTGAR